MARVSSKIKKRSYQSNLKHSECTVRGPLGLVLYISRVLGQAPLQFSKFQSNRRMRVSYAVHFYGNIGNIIFVIMSNFSLIADLLIGMKKSSMINPPGLVWICNVFLFEAVCVAGAYYGAKKMGHLIDILAQLDEINEELNRYHAKAPPHEKFTWFISVFFIAWCAYNTFSNYSLFYMEAVTGYHLLFLSMFYAFNRILWLTPDVLVVLFVLSTLRILWTLTLLNECLLDILHEIHHDCMDTQIEPTSNFSVEIKMLISKGNGYKNTLSTNKSINYIIDSLAINEGKINERITPNKLRRLAYFYSLLCEMVRNLNDSSGLELVLLFLAYLMHLVVPIYLSVVRIFYSETRFRKAFSTNEIWKYFSLINDIGKVIALVEPCDQTHRQMALTKNLVSQMMCYTATHDYPLINELKLFTRHLTLNKAAYAPLQLFTLNRVFIITFLGNITTYVMALLQI